MENTDMEKRELTLLDRDFQARWTVVNEKLAKFQELNEKELETQASYYDIVAKNAGTVLLNESERLQKSKKLLMYLDIDATILHATIDPRGEGLYKGEMSDIIEVLTFLEKSEPGEVRKVPYYICLRPFFDWFLESVSKYYQIALYTAGSQTYADKILNLIDPNRNYITLGAFSRDSTGDRTRKYSSLIYPCPEEMVVILDDRPEVWDLARNVFSLKPYWVFPDKNTRDFRPRYGVLGPEENKLLDILCGIDLEKQWSGDECRRRAYQDTVLKTCSSVFLTAWKMFYEKRAGSGPGQTLNVINYLTSIRHTVFSKCHILLSPILLNPVLLHACNLKAAGLHRELVDFFVLHNVDLKVIIKDFYPKDEWSESILSQIDTLIQDEFIRVLGDMKSNSIDPNQIFFSKTLPFLKNSLELSQTEKASVPLFRSVILYGGTPHEEISEDITHIVVPSKCISPMTLEFLKNCHQTLTKDCKVVTINWIYESMIHVFRQSENNFLPTGGSTESRVKKFQKDRSLYSGLTPYYEIRPETRSSTQSIGAPSYYIKAIFNNQEGFKEEESDSQSDQLLGLPIPKTKEEIKQDHENLLKKRKQSPVVHMSSQPKKRVIVGHTHPHISDLALPVPFPSVTITSEAQYQNPHYRRQETFHLPFPHLPHANMFSPVPAIASPPHRPQYTRQIKPPQFITQQMHFRPPQPLRNPSLMMPIPNVSRLPMPNPRQRRPQQRPPPRRNPSRTVPLRVQNRGRKPNFFKINKKKPEVDEDMAQLYLGKADAAAPIRDYEPYERSRTRSRDRRSRSPESSSDVHRESDSEGSEGFQRMRNFRKQKADTKKSAPKPVAIENDSTEEGEL